MTAGTKEQADTRIDEAMGIVMAMGDLKREELAILLRGEWPMFVPLERIICSFFAEYSRPPEIEELRDALNSAAAVLEEKGVATKVSLPDNLDPRYHH